MQWLHQSSLRKNMFKVRTCEGKVLTNGLLVEWRNHGGGILGESCSNKFRATFADITEVKIRNSKDSAEQEEESSPLPAWQRQAQGRELKQWGGLFSLILPTVPIYHPPTSTFWPPERCNPMTPFWDNGELKHGVCEEIRRFSKRFYGTGMTASKGVLIMKVTLWKYNFNFVKDILTI